MSAQSIKPGVFHGRTHNDDFCQPDPFSRRTTYIIHEWSKEDFDNFAQTVDPEVVHAIRTDKGRPTYDEKTVALITHIKRTKKRLDHMQWHAMRMKAAHRLTDDQCRDAIILAARGRFAITL